MPIYEYQCNKCQHHFEVIQKINDKPISVCPECSSKQVQKLVSSAGFQLKGTGWYVTDFKNNDKPKQNPKPKSSSNNESAKPVAKQDATASSKGDNIEK